MSTTVFGEAARLYVENLDVVNEMRKAYERDADAMVTALEEAVAKEVAPVRFRANTVGKSRYWWLGEANFEAGLWFYQRDPAHIDHESLMLLCGVRELTNAKRDALAKLPAHDPTLFEAPDRVGQWSLCCLEIPFAHDFDVTAAARRIATALRGITEIVEATTDQLTAEIAQATTDQLTV